MSDGTAIARRLRVERISRDLGGDNHDLPTAEILRHRILNGCHALVSQHKTTKAGEGRRHYLRLSRTVFYVRARARQPCPEGCSLAYFSPGRGPLAVTAHLTAKRREMKNRTSVSEVSATLGYPSNETVQGLRLWKAFVKLSPAQRSEVLAWVEHLATDPAPLPGGMNGRVNPR